MKKYTTLESIVDDARTLGYEIGGLQHADAIAVMQQAGHRHEPTIWKRLGLIK